MVQQLYIVNTILTLLSCYEELALPILRVFNGVLSHTVVVFVIDAVDCNEWYTTLYMFSVLLYWK